MSAAGILPASLIWVAPLRRSRDSMRVARLSTRRSGKELPCRVSFLSPQVVTRCREMRLFEVRQGELDFPARCRYQTSCDAR